MASPTGSAFRYFPDASLSPHSTWTAKAQPCGVCGAIGPGFDGPYYGEGDLSFACALCLSSGRLGATGASANSGDQQALRAQLRSLDPEHAEGLANERTRELEERTPHVTTWQELQWPAHCGDYCAFQGEVGQRELAALAPDGDGEVFFRRHLHPDYQDVTPDYAELVPPHRAKPGEAWEVGVWLFRCLGCQTAVLLWDAS